MSDAPKPLDLPVQFEIAAPRGQPGPNRIISPSQARARPGQLVGPDEAVRLAKSIGMSASLCGACRYFDLDKGRQALAQGGRREQAAMAVAEKSGWFGEAEFGACRLRANTLTQATGTCEAWEPRKLVSFTGQGSRG